MLELTFLWVTLKHFDRIHDIKLKDTGAPMNSLTPFDQKQQLLKVHNQLKGIIYTKWHPGCSISSLSKLLLIFQMKCCHFPCRLCSCTLKLPLCSCSLCKHNIYPHAWCPETPVAYQVAMATARCTQACFHAAGTHAALHPQGECWENEAEGQGWRGHILGINSVESTVLTVDKHVLAFERKQVKKKQRIQTENCCDCWGCQILTKIEKMFWRQWVSEWVGGLWGPIQNLCIKLLKNELLTPAKKTLDQNSFNACLGCFFSSSSFISKHSKVAVQAEPFSWIFLLLNFLLWLY